MGEAVRRGVTQYVILGAGLDTFAYRNPHPELRVFEVDHPATQAWKRSRLEAACIPVPANLTFTPVDFERETFDQGLAREGFDVGAQRFLMARGDAVSAPGNRIEHVRTHCSIVSGKRSGIRLCGAARIAEDAPTNGV